MADFPPEAQLSVFSSVRFRISARESRPKIAKNAYTEYERKEMCTSEMREKKCVQQKCVQQIREKKKERVKNKSTGNDYAIAANLAVKVVPYRTDPFSETP